MKEKNGSDRFHRDADERLVARIAEHYSPPALTSAERADFDARLRARVAEARANRAWLPALGAAAATAGVAAWLVLGAGLGSLPPATATRAGTATGPETLAAWEREVLYAGTLAVDDDEAEEDAAELPEPYVSIASLLLE